MRSRIPRKILLPHPKLLLATLRFNIIPIMVTDTHTAEVGLALLVHGCTCRRRCLRKRLKPCRHLWPSFCTLMELWYLDTMLAGTLFEISSNDRLLAFNIWSAVTTAPAFLLEGWLRWRKIKPTLRFYMMSYAVLMNTSGYHACRGIEMALGFRDWEEGRQLDIAIVAALSFAVGLLLPLLGVLFFGRRRLFRLLSEWLDQRRGQKLQDGAFMAMLLDSYLVELGQTPGSGSKHFSIVAVARS